MGEVTRIDEWRPNYETGCEVCGIKPVVAGYRNGQRVFAGTLCGPHNFGTAEALDPLTWNEGGADE